MNHIIIEALAVLAALAVGFGLGRIKNAAKLAAIAAEIAAIEIFLKSDLNKLEAVVVDHVKQVIASIKATL